MVRILRYAFLAFFITIWAIGLTTYVSVWLSKKGLITDKMRYGDLYQFSTLPQFKQAWPVYTPSQRSNDTASTHLYIIGDSFTDPLFLTKSDFRVSHYQRWGGSPPTKTDIQLDSTKRNVLLIECAERNIRLIFNESIVPIDLAKYVPPPTNWLIRLSGRYGARYHRFRVEGRIESALFNHDWVFWFKEMKATLTLNWFDRTDPRVGLSANKKHIFYYMDNDSREVKSSSFAKLSQPEIDTLVANINTTVEYYRSIGFKEVYFSIIPSKASILETQRTDYNHLIERIAESPCLNVPMVNVYDAFKRSPVSPYLKGDTHWNLQGRAIWLDSVWHKLKV